MRSARRPVAGPSTGEGEYRVGPGKPTDGTHVLTRPSGSVFVRPTGGDPVSFRFLTGPAYRSGGNADYTVTVDYATGADDVILVNIKDEQRDTP